MKPPVESTDCDDNFSIVRNIEPGVSFVSPIHCYCHSCLKVKEIIKRSRYSMSFHSLNKWIFGSHWQFCRKLIVWVRLEIKLFKVLRELSCLVTRDEK